MVANLVRYSINQDDKKIIFMSEDGTNIANLHELIKEHGLSIVSEILGDKSIPLHPDTWRIFLHATVHAMMFPDLGPEFEQGPGGEFLKDFAETVMSEIATEIGSEVDSIELNPETPIIPEDEVEHENSE